MTRTTIMSTLNNSDEGPEEKPKSKTSTKSTFKLVGRGAGDLKTRFRPRRLDELAPTCPIKQLKKFIDNENSSQVFLFEGETGTGKTTSARIIARANICLSEDKDKPCLECKACKSFDKSSDVMEINAADCRKIDDIRAIIKDMQYLPVDLKKKIYIFDEIHQLTPDSQQALLKELEEPPKYLLVFMCTTEVKGLNKALLHRANAVTFKSIDIRNAKQLVTQVLEENGSEADTDTIKSFWNNSGGSVRKLLNNVQAYLEGGYDPDKTDEEDHPEPVKKLGTAILAADWKAAKKQLLLYSSKKDPESLRMGVESYIRGALLREDEETAEVIAKILAPIIQVDLTKPTLSQYNSLVVSCLNAVVIARVRNR